MPKTIEHVPSWGSYDETRRTLTFEVSIGYPDDRTILGVEIPEEKIEAYKGDKTTPALIELSIAIARHVRENVHVLDLFDTVALPESAPTRTAGLLTLERLREMARFEYEESDDLGRWGEPNAYDFRFYRFAIFGGHGRHVAEAVMGEDEDHPAEKIIRLACEDVYFETSIRAADVKEVITAPGSGISSARACFIVKDELERLTAAEGATIRKVTGYAARLMEAANRYLEGEQSAEVTLYNGEAMIVIEVFHESGASSLTFNLNGNDADDPKDVILTLKKAAEEVAL